MVFVLAALEDDVVLILSLLVLLVVLLILDFLSLEEAPLVLELALTDLDCAEALEVEVVDDEFEVFLVNVGNDWVGIEMLALGSISFDLLQLGIDADAFVLVIFEVEDVELFLEPRLNTVILENTVVPRL